MHTAALAALGLSPEWSYEAIEVSPEDFSGLVRSLPGDGFAGVNVTVPHKLRALAVADTASAAARAIGAANTLTFAEGRIHAENTDAIAIAEALAGSADGKKALVLGAGGSARAAVWALREAGAEVNIWNRTAERAEMLAAEFKVGLDAENPQIVVNATTVGLETANGVHPLRGSGGSDLKALPVFDDGLQAEVVMDLVYGLRETELIAAAKTAGATTVDGLEILVRQGGASLRTWTGTDPPLDVMRCAARGET